MGIFSKLFGSSDGGSSSEDRFVKKHVTRLLNKYGQKELREDSMHALYQRGSHEAIMGLMQRFTYNHPEGIIDEKDKKYVIQLLCSLGAEKSGPAVREYLANPKQSEVSMVLVALDELEGPENTITEVLQLLDDGDPGDPWSNARKLQMIGHLDNYKEIEGVKETIPALVRYLEDIDDDVMFRCVELLGELGEDDDIRNPLLDRMVDEDTSARIRARILEVAKDRRWYLGDRRKEIEPILPDGFYFDRRDNLKQRDAGPNH